MFKKVMQEGIIQNIKWGLNMMRKEIWEGIVQSMKWALKMNEGKRLKKVLLLQTGSGPSRLKNWIELDDIPNMKWALKRLKKALF